MTEEMCGKIALVGVSGKLGSGKNYIVEQTLVRYGFTPIALANHFKVDAVVKDGAPITEVFGSKKSTETRRALQLRGTEEGRDVYGHDIWLKVAEAWIYGAYQAGWRRFAVTDVRFPNEVEWVRSLGGLVYRIVGRGGAAPDTAAANHESETALDYYTDFDGYIDNSRANETWVRNEVYAKLSRKWPQLFIGGKSGLLQEVP